MTYDALLKRVSRSFYLSLCFLPASVRHPLSLAYLLARASDTIADCSDLPAAERISLLEALPDHAPSGLTVSDSGEQELLDSLPTLLAARTNSPDHAAIENVWQTIRRGQIFDLLRFPSDVPLSPQERENYIYLVAGCVGEFWTDIGFQHVPGYSSQPAAGLRTLGREFGCGLQLVNILRDHAADAAAGRLYFAEHERDDLLRRARSAMAAGTSYASAVRPRRLRAAVALPADLGLRTLDLIARAPSAPKVKVSRRRVWLSLAAALLR